MLPQQIILLRAAADYFDSFPANAFRSDVYKPANTLATITVVAGDSGAADEPSPGNFLLTLPSPGGNAAPRIPVAGVTGWESSTFLIYDTDMAVVHEVDHVILALLSAEGVNELNLATLAYVGELAISRATDSNSGQVDLHKVAVEMRILYGFHFVSITGTTDYCNNSITRTRRIVASRVRINSDGLPTPRSMRETYVRSTPASRASPSWENRSSRRRRLTLAESLRRNWSKRLSPMPGSVPGTGYSIHGI